MAQLLHNLLLRDGNGKHPPTRVGEDWLTGRPGTWLVRTNFDYRNGVVMGEGRTVAAN
jgi:hypothetical protein